MKKKKVRVKKQIEVVGSDLSYLEPYAKFYLSRGVLSGCFSFKELRGKSKESEGRE